MCRSDIVLKRKIYDKLISWKDNHRNNCLMVIGARQVGKTYIIREFGDKNYERFYELNFISNKEYQDIFSGDIDAGTILRKMSLVIPNFEIVPNKTLIFLDEIQDCPNAITALKFLAQDNNFDCIASGSMLGMAYKRVTSFPVGYVDRVYMDSLDFEEFCWANGCSCDAIKYLKEDFLSNKAVSDSVHKRMLELFKSYIVLGGMPDVINEFLETQNYNLAQNVQRRIISDYKDDIIKYADETDKVKIRACFDSIPFQLAKENKKFKYKVVEKNSNKKKYYGALQWLYDAGIINFCYNLTNPEFPFEGNKIDDCFKVYMRDTGLLVAMLDDGTNTDIMNGNLAIYKGAIYENVIADIFHKLGKKLYYFEKNSTLEIDFFIRFEDVATAVEVKSADNTKSKSLKSVMSNYNVAKGIKLSAKNSNQITENVISMPLYMCMFL